ncbi:MAG: EamA family transporter [Clostridiales bacterium]|nr:EamA family transporter [Clostridiales bacterium]
MNDLIMAFLCSGSISILFKFNENRELNRYVVTTFNYVTAVILSVAFSSNIKVPGFGDLSIVLKDISEGIPFGMNESMTWAVLIGILTGIMFFLTFIMYQFNVRKYGPSLTGMFGKLGILIPMIFSIFIFKEYPSIIQSIGILLSFTSILIINLTGDFKWELKPWLLLFFFLGGFAEFSNKIFQKYAMIEFKSVFLLTVFLTALIISFIKIIPHIRTIKSKEILSGMIVGVPNFFSSYFLINALRSLPTSVVFPVYSAGSILTIIFLSRWLFKESFSKRKWIAVGMTVIALALINFN